MEEGAGGAPPGAAVGAAAAARHNRAPPRSSRPRGLRKSGRTSAAPANASPDHGDSHAGPDLDGHDDLDRAREGDATRVAADARQPLRLSYQERKELQRRHRQVEKRIVELEERQEQLAAVLSSPAHSSDYQVLVDALEEAARLADELHMLYEEWESLTDRVVALDA